MPALNAFYVLSMAELDWVFELLSTTFNLPTDWFSSPMKLLLFFIVPMLSLAAFWTSLLVFKLRIFSNTSVNFGLGLIVAMVNSAAIGWMTPAGATAFGLGGALLLTGETKWWRVALAAVAFLLVLYLYPPLLEYLESLTYAAAG